jgi:hypothetical protein
MATNGINLADLLGAANDSQPSQPSGNGGISLADLLALGRAAARVTGLGAVPSIAQTIAQATGMTSNNPTPQPDPSAIDLPVDSSQFSPEFVAKQEQRRAAGWPDWYLRFERQQYLALQQRARQLSGTGLSRGAAATPVDLLTMLPNPGMFMSSLLPYPAPATPADILSNAAGPGR